MSQILLVSAGIFHPSLMARAGLRRALRGYRLRQVASLEALPRLNLAGYRGIVLFFHRQIISTAALASLDGFVAGGGGVLAVHSASASFKQQDGYFAILGGRFTHHGPIQPFEVIPTVPQNAFFGQISAFTVTDELYRHAFDPAVRVHFHAVIGDEREPIVWTKPHGAGRVCYCALGHRADTLRHPSVQAILRRGLAWACRIEEA